MVEWAKRRGVSPARIVDPGVGSGRYLIAAGHAFPEAELVGVDTDPLATLMARANVAAHGFTKRARLLLGDYTQVRLPSVNGRTLFIGNPPYVRHHALPPSAKRWLVREASRLGLGASQLSGLHIYFFLATVLNARKGDAGCFITAAEWLEVNYGKLLRELFVRHLGGLGLTIIDPTAAPFGDTATTAVISTFEIGSQSASVVVQRVQDPGALRGMDAGVEVLRARLEREPRWSHLTVPAPRSVRDSVPLGELFRVHRGQVTGANRIWIAERDSRLPSSVLFKSITRAKELFAAGEVLRDDCGLREVIDLPADLSGLSPAERRAIDEFLRAARAAGADRGYIAANRRPWWAVGLRKPAPILATYMARRAPAFVRNRANVRHINVAHGLYPVEPLKEQVLMAVVRCLNRTTSVSSGRTYAGGLTKFEPREMERIPVPLPNVLTEQSA
jgi:methylase of polypeptide subunit release factors